MKKNPPPQQILPGLYCFFDTCNVYVICGQTSSIAIDFGSGAWLKQAGAMKLPPIKRVYLTHHHPDQCEGLLSLGSRSFSVHAPVGDEALLSPRGVKSFWKHRRDAGIPASYAVLPRGLTRIQYDMAGFTDHFWGDQRIRFLHTPGHGANATSILMDCDHKQIVFCGDAAHAGATIWQPYCLEWDHWTGAGALAARQGIKTLWGVGMEMLCPSHGPVVTEKPRPMLAKLAGKLDRFADVKGSICPGEKDHYLKPTWTRRGGRGARCLLDGLYQFGANGYLLVSANNQGLVIDPWLDDLPALSDLLKDLPNVTLTDAVATHYHADHLSAMPTLKQRFKLTTWLHPRVALPIAKIGKIDVPWLVSEAIKPDRYLPNQGTWKCNQFTFRVAPFAGQTWWHCCFMTSIAGQKVLFAGDNFQPASRWNGTGGFCSMNGSRFKEGWLKSAKLVLRWKPDILCNGHGTYQHYHASQFQKIVRWSQRAERATRALCPDGQLEQAYYLHAI